MDYGYINHVEGKTEEITRLITSFKQDLASAGVRLKAVCFYESNATAMVSQAIMSQAIMQCLPTLVADLRIKHSRVKHIISHGEINGVEIISPGDKE